METSAHLGRERTCGETEPASSSWAEPESYSTQGSRRPIYFDRLSSMRRTNFHSSSSTSTFFPGHRLSPMRIPNSGHETFDTQCGRAHPWSGHMHFQAFLSPKTFISFLCLASQSENTMLERPFDVEYLRLSSNANFQCPRSPHKAHRFFFTPFGEIAFQ